MADYLQIPCLIERCDGVPVKSLIYRLLEVEITELNLTGQVIASECSHPRGEFSHSLLTMRMLDERRGAWSSSYWIVRGRR